MKTTLLLPALLVLFLYKESQSQLCSQSGPKYARVVQNDNSTGSVGWNNIINSILVDNEHSKAGVLLGILASAKSNYIIFKDFDFQIPPGAAICGIEVTRIGSVDGLLIGSSVKDDDVRIIKNNTITGTQHATSTSWPATDGSATWGGNQDKWGASWTAEEINDPGFGIAISVKLSAGLASLFLTAKIEAVSINVYYNLVLPLEAPRLTAEIVDDRVRLEWMVDDEDGSNFYIVQRKANANAWQSLDTVHNARLAWVRNAYESYDNSPLPVNEYRVLNVLPDGRAISSQPVRVVMNQRKTKLTLFPNPGNGIYYLKGDGITSIDVFRSDGSMVPFKKSPHGNAWRIELNETPGIYFVRAGTNEGFILKQVMLVK